MEEHDVDVAEGIQLAAAVAADGDERERQRPALPSGRPSMAASSRWRRTMSTRLRAFRANLAPAAAAVVLQPDAVVLDLEELLVEREQLRRARALPWSEELLLGVGEDLFAVGKHGWSGK